MATVNKILFGTQSKRVYSLVLVLILITSGYSESALSQSIRPVALRCEYRHNPIAIDEKQPLLAWTFETTDTTLRGQIQTAYQILVASSPELLATGEGDFWDSGLIESEQNTNIIYDGKSLFSRATCFWKVRVRDGKGNLSGWSDPARWEMGLLERSDWKGN